MLGEFIGEFLGEMIIAPIFKALWAVVWWVIRNGFLLVLYPIMLFTGWLRLWLRERGRNGFQQLWQAHGHTGLHRFGWQEAALDVECLMATLLITLALGGVYAVTYGFYRLFIS